MPPPPRTTDADYHFHAYDYDGSNAPWTLSPAQPDRNNLRFYSMVRDLAGLEQTGQQNDVPDIALANAGQAIAADGRNFSIKVLSFGSTAQGTPQVVITGGIHAREWVAPEMAYLLAEYLIMNHPPNNVPNGNLNQYQRWVRDTLNGRRIHVIPMLNPAGNSFSVFGQDGRMWRKNRRRLPTTADAWHDELYDPEIPGATPPFRDLATAQGVTSYQVPQYAKGAPVTDYDTIPLPNDATVGVDLNRNFPTSGYGHDCAPHFDEGKPNEEGYFGTGAASELETRNVRAFLDGSANLGCSIDYHSYGKFILYPSEASDRGRVNANYTALGEILQRLIGPAEVSWWDYDYKLGTPMDVLKYDAVGTLGDQIALSHNARAFVVELDPRKGVGFELAEDQIRTVFEKNIRGALALLQAAGQASTVQNVRDYYLFNRRTITSGESQFLGWNVFNRGNRLPA